MSKLEDLVRASLARPEAELTFEDTFLARQIEDNGLVFCCDCQKFIDNEAHNIDHVFARTLEEIRLKSVVEKLAGKVKDG